MTPFETLVKKMREAQKAYDKSATNDRRIAAIKAQEVVDSYLAKLPVYQIQEPTQTTLL